MGRNAWQQLKLKMRNRSKIPIQGWGWKDNMMACKMDKKCAFSHIWGWRIIWSRRQVHILICTFHGGATFYVIYHYKFYSQQVILIHWSVNENVHNVMLYHLFSSHGRLFMGITNSVLYIIISTIPSLNLHPLILLQSHYFLN